MLKTYKYRLYPTKKQKEKLDWTLNTCRILYNSCLVDRNRHYEETGKGLSRMTQQKILVGDKKNIEYLTNIHSQVLQDVLMRVEKTYKAFFRRVKAKKGKAGYPRFKNYGRYDSITYTQSGFGIDDTGKLSLSKIGHIKLKLHRNISGIIKTCAIKKEIDKWYVCFSVEYKPIARPIPDKKIGIDMGIKSFASLSGGKVIDNTQSPDVKAKYYISDDIQLSLFDLLETPQPIHKSEIKKVHKVYFSTENRVKSGSFQLQNRRFLGNKYKLLGFIEDIVNEKCNGFGVFCDIFAGTGVVSERFNEKNIKVIANDFLVSNFLPLRAFLGTSEIDFKETEKKIDILNNIEERNDNYFSEHFGNTFFTLENARKIGAIREKINDVAKTDNEKAVLITSLIYAVDKVANTVGHYDAFRKKLDTVQPLLLLVPYFKPKNNSNNEVHREDANQLIRRIKCDVLYIDPPYNSRQYSDAYHLLENLASWEKPLVYGKAKKMNRSHIKSYYCLQSASKAFADLISNSSCGHILVSYNNTGESKDGRSNARIGDEQIIDILKTRGKVDIFERDYKAFTTGKSYTDGHTERVFYCKVTK